ncbi:MAG: DUF4058 family protein [Planctomycetales bacterium]
MPIHNWSKVGANRFHHFHQDWTVQFARSLNGGALLPGYMALVESITGGPEPDVVTLSLPVQPNSWSAGGIAIADKPPRARVQAVSDATIYARKGNRVTIRHPDGEVVAVIEIISPGNKESAHGIRSFARKAVDFLYAGVHLLIVDLFPPTPRDPQGIHKLIWDRIKDEPYELPPGRPFTLAAYAAGATITAYVENVGVGDLLPEMPIFLTPERYVPCPLERTYQESWTGFPDALKGDLEPQGAS